MRDSSSGENHLLRALGLAFGVAVAFGAMIGAGILRTPGGVLNHLPSAPLAIGLWIFGAIHALVGANVVSELMTSVPRSGGLFVPARAAFGQTAGFLIGWSDWLNMVAAVAALAIAAGEFSAIMIPRLRGDEALVGAMLIMMFFAINWRGVREGSRAQIASSAAKGLFLIILVALILFLPNSPPPAAPPPPLSRAAAPVSLLGALVAYQLIFGVYSGWPNAAYFAEEDVDPGRNIPRSMFLSILGVALLYLAINGALIHAVPIERLRESQLPLALAVSAVLGPFSMKIIAAGAVLIVLGCLNANIMVGPRILYGLARDGLFPKFATRINDGGTPGVALVITIALSLLLTFTGSFEAIFLVMGAFAVFPMLVADASLFKLRRSQPALRRPYRAIGYPVLPAIALALDFGLLVSFMVTDPMSGVSVVVAVALCIPVAALAGRRRTRLVAEQ